MKTPITTSIMVDNGGEKPHYCLMAAFRSKEDALAAQNVLLQQTLPFSDPEVILAVREACDRVGEDHHYYDEVTADACSKAVVGILRSNALLVGTVESAAQGAGGFHVKLAKDAAMPNVGDHVYIGKVS
jgi:hypothetical protein